MSTLDNSRCATQASFAQADMKTQIYQGIERDDAVKISPIARPPHALEPPSDRQRAARRPPVASLPAAHRPHPNRPLFTVINGGMLKQAPIG